MNDTGKPVTTDETVVRFPSFAEMRAAHTALLKCHREAGATDECLTRMEAFIRRGQATGALLDVEDERWAGQSWLDYWSSMMYRAGQEPPESTLAEFDATLAPELPDSLCPYVGLDAFREVNNNVFFGRGRLVKEMLERLRENRLLAVVGASGSGKSSLVRAGLLPALRAGGLPGSQEWHYYPPMVPGSAPLWNLTRLIRPSDADEARSLQHHAARLQQSAGHLFKLVDELCTVPAVLVVDQFEELFTLCDDDLVRQSFVDNLLGLVQSPEARHVVVLTMRTDFEGLVAWMPAFQPIFEAARMRVAPMNAAELREAIEGPAEKVGLRFEEGVVDGLLHDILGEPAALPLLQFTLLKLWENRERNRVTWNAYRRLGGGRLALARSADEFYDGLIPEEQVTAKRILLRMVRPGEGLEVTSNRIRRETLYQAGEARDRVDRVLGRLVEARLVRLTEGDTLADAQVEVAHEALVRNWPRLVDWLDEERAQMRRRIRLAASAEQWDALGRKPEALWRGLLLEEALRYEDLNELEAEFVRASQAAVEEARRKEEEARQRELEQARRLAEEQQQRAEEQARAAARLRVLLAALAALFVLAVGAGVAVIRQTQENARLAIAATAEAGNAAAAVTQAAAKEVLVAALDAQATAVAELAAAEARGDEIAGAQATVQAREATSVAARETDQAREAIAVAARETAKAAAMTTPTIRPTETPRPTVEPTFTPTSTPIPIPTPTSTPTLPKVAFASQSAAIFAAPSADSAVLAFVKVGEAVTVIGRSESGRWLYILDAGGIEGFVALSYFDWPGDPAILPTRLPTVTITPLPPARVFEIVYEGCQFHTSDLGSVKGQVFDAEGGIIVGAQVEIWIDGQRWDNPANPATTNQDGWYEWTLGTGQIVRFAALYIDGQSVPFESAPDPFEVEAKAGCFQRVNFRER